VKRWVFVEIGNADQTGYLARGFFVYITTTVGAIKKSSPTCEIQWKTIFEHCSLKQIISSKKDYVMNILDFKLARRPKSNQVRKLN